MLTSAKLRGPRHYKVYFLKLHMDVYLSAKFEGWGGGVILPPTSKRTPKKPTQIRVKVRMCEHQGVSALTRNSVKYNDSIKEYQLS